MPSGPKHVSGPATRPGGEESLGLAEPAPLISSTFLFDAALNMGNKTCFFLAISCNFGSFLSDDNDEKPDLTRFNHLIFLGLKDLTI